MNRTGLNRFKGQFFQWYYVKYYPLTQIHDYFGILFDYLRTNEGSDYHASLNQWALRSVRWKGLWQLNEEMRGRRDLRIPPDVLGYPVWFQGAPSVEEFEQYLRSNSNIVTNTTTQSFDAADTTESLTNDDGNTDSLAETSSDHGHNQLSQAPLPIAQPFSMSERVGDQYYHPPQVPNTGLTNYGYLASEPQSVERNTFSPTPPQANFAAPLFNEYNPAQPPYSNPASGSQGSYYPQPSPSLQKGNQPRLPAGPPVPFQGIEYSQPHSSQPFPVGLGITSVPNAPDAASFHGYDPNFQFDPRVPVQDGNYPLFQSYPLQGTLNDPSLSIGPSVTNLQGNHPQIQTHPWMPLQGSNYAQSQPPYQFQATQSGFDIPNSPTIAGFQETHPQFQTDPSVPLEHSSHPQSQPSYLLPGTQNNTSPPVAPPVTNSPGNQSRLQIDPRVPLQNSSHPQSQSSYPMPATQTNPNMPVADAYGNPPRQPDELQEPLQNSMLNSSTDVPKPSNSQNFRSRRF